MTVNRIALVRHGETDWNALNLFQGRTDRSLNDVGCDQAYQAAFHLADSHWDRVISSPLLRARQTASIIAGRLGVAAQEHAWDDLTERAFGLAEGVDRDVAISRWPDLEFPDGESLEAVDVRLFRAWAQLKDMGSATIAVTHLVVIRGLVRIAMGADPGTISNGSIVSLEQTEDRWILSSYTEAAGPAV